MLLPIIAGGSCSAAVSKLDMGIHSQDQQGLNDIWAELRRIGHTLDDGHLAMVYDAFVDDSKDRHAEKVVVSGIFIGDKNRWGLLRTKWQRRLDVEGMKYFKASEYYGLRGEFRKFQSESNYP